MRTRFSVGIRRSAIALLSKIVGLELCGRCNFERVGRKGFDLDHDDLAMAGLQYARRPALLFPRLALAGRNAFGGGLSPVLLRMNAEIVP